MELKEDETIYQTSKKNSVDFKGYFVESNAGHLSVQTTSPFKMKTRESEYAVDQCTRYNNNSNSNGCEDERLSLFKKFKLNKKLPKDACSSATSKLLVSQIIKENNLHAERLSLKENLAVKAHCSFEPCKYTQIFLNHTDAIKNFVPIFNSNYSSVPHGSTSKEELIVPVATTSGYPTSKYKKNDLFPTIILDPKIHTEKSTYCRPVLKYNQQLLNKTIERNARLQKLIKNLVLARKREKETQAWNNYINQLKTKHGYHDNGYCVNNHAENTEEHEYSLSSRNLNPCDQLLQEVHLSNNILKSDRYQNDTPMRCYNRYSDCYPISSQGRIIMIQKGQIKEHLQDSYECLHRARHNKTIRVEQNFKREKSNSENLCDRKIQTNVTNDTLKKLEKISSIENLKNQKNRLSHNTESLGRKFKEPIIIDEPDMLASIENKLDILIASLTLFIDQVNNQNSKSQSEYVSFKKIGNEGKVSRSQSEAYDLIKAEASHYDHTRISENSIRSIIEKSSLKLSHHKNNINDIITEEINNSKRAKDEIENLLCGASLHSCPVNVSLDIPTKETCTSSDSLSKGLHRFQDRSVTVQEIKNDEPGEHQKKTIAVNTDPLGLMALLRISTDTVKQLISYMPNLLYYYSLPMIDASQGRSGFACNICGAVFESPTQLSEHIQHHNKSETRKCCICHHLLASQAFKTSGLFSCQYCGQHFKRAYCCELHQEACAKRLGLKHDVTPSLILLR